MQQIPSQRLCDWIEDQLRTQAPGYRFPSDAELAASFSVSPRTVERILKRYKQSGWLVRIRGRGTFLPGGPALDYHTPQPQRSSAQSIVDVMRDAICSGSLKKGDALPQVKYISRKFKAGAATVSRAYRQLERMGYVVKVGKTYWVGAFDTIVKRRPHQDVYLFKHGSLDFSDIFTTDMLAPAYRMLERELVGSGYIMRFESTENLQTILQTSLRVHRPPSGIILFRTNQDAFAQTYPLVKSFLSGARRIGDVRTPVLLDWELGGIFKSIPRRVHVFSRGHVSTSNAKAVARFLVGSPYRHVSFFIDMTRLLWHIPALSSMLKAWTEVRNLNRSLRLRWIALGTAGANSDRAYMQHLQSTYPLDIQRATRKYEGILLEDFERDLSIAPSLNAALEKNHGAELWIFSNAAHAARAVEWAGTRGMDVPGRISIISLENSHFCYHLGISYCDVDWEKIGHVMAHTITGVLPVVKTTKGFIQTDAHVVERLTTR